MNKAEIFWVSFDHFELQYLKVSFDHFELRKTKLGFDTHCETVQKKIILKLQSVEIKQMCHQLQRFIMKRASKIA